MSPPAPPSAKGSAPPRPPRWETSPSPDKPGGASPPPRPPIRYRLDRVGELTGLDVDKSEDREQLTLGIKAMQLLGRLPEQPSSFSDK